MLRKVPYEPFERVDVNSWEVDRDETSGVEEKVWLLEPGTNPPAPWLFKSVTADAELVCGEDLAEKAAAQFGVRLGVPCARVELARRGGRRGSLSASLCPPRYQMQLQHGALLLQDRDAPGYVTGRVPGRPGHTLENIRLVLDGALPPPGCSFPFQATAFDIFAGFTVFDALIANRDRHDENWAVLLPIAGEGPTRLCGSYDHANSLGYNLNDKKRLMYLQRDGGVLGWCLKGTAFRYEHRPGKAPPTLVEMAVRALALASPEAREYWPDILDDLVEDEIRGIVARLPELSEAARTFTTEVVLVNRKRLLDACA